MRNRYRAPWSILLRGLIVTTFASVFFIGIGNGVRAQDATPATTPATVGATVSVSGHGSVTVVPDAASVVVGIDVIKSTLDQAQVEAAEQMTAIISALKTAGINDEDIQTVNFSVFIIRNYDSQSGTPAEITGYEVQNQINVTVRDISQLGSLLDTVVAEGANSIYGITFFVADPSEATSQARVLAVQDAQQKAQELASASGLQLGNVISISEGLGSSFSPSPFGMGGAQSAAGSPIQTGTTDISVDVQMTFQMFGQ